MAITLTLKPHPACKARGELIDIFSNDTSIPWASVHIDTFHISGTKSSENELYQRLYANMETVRVTLVIEDEAVQ